MCSDKKEKVKNILLSLLDTPEIQQKIRFIVVKEDDSQAAAAAVSLNSALSMPDQETSQRLIELQNDNKALRKQNQHLKAEVENGERESSRKTDQIKELQHQIAIFAD